MPSSSVIEAQVADGACGSPLCGQVEIPSWMCGNYLGGQLLAHVRMSHQWTAMCMSPCTAEIAGGVCVCVAGVGIKS
eukprot:991564-Amphidinium_carterae.1